MEKPVDFRALGCRECMDGKALDFDFSMAFQPIVDTAAGSIFAQEALVRGVGNEPAGTLFSKVHDGNRYMFDQTCRVKAIGLAAKLGLDAFLSINFMPNAVYRPELCIRTTLAAADDFGAEYDCLRDLGIVLFQGYYFARPGFETLPAVDPALYR